MTHIYKIEKGTHADLDGLAVLYDQLNDSLEAGTNYPGWIKGIYPVRETARQGIEEGSLFILKIDDNIAGSVILSHEPEIAYKQVKWKVDTDYENIIVIRTLVVHPSYMKKGVAVRLMKFAEEYARTNQMKSIRLDVSVHNIPAIALYEKLGYDYIGMVDLGLDYPHLKWFKLFEFVL